MGAPPGHKARLASVAASTVVALACGTNYAYSAWGPEFADKLGLSATESNIIGVAGNMGMYCSGIPAGLLVDRKSPQWGVVVGAVALLAGYLPIYRAYRGGPEAASLVLVSCGSFLTGLGSCTAFSAAVKTSTYNWPRHRGTASAFPLSGFGLSAFFFALLGNIAFAGRTGGFLLMLAVGTFVMNVVALPFMRLLPPAASASSGAGVYEALAAEEEEEEEDGGNVRGGRESFKYDAAREADQRGEYQRDEHAPFLDNRGAALDSGYGTGASSPVAAATTTTTTTGRSRPPSPPAARSLERGGGLGGGGGDGSDEADGAHTFSPAELTGVALLREGEFWQLFVMMGLLAGVGLMTINNIGHDTKALWTYYDPAKSARFVQAREQLQVSILSVGSFAGRFLSGIGSDYLVKRLRASRFWCLAVSALVFVLAQLLALFIYNPHFLFLVSSLVGVGYGALFGVMPSLSADRFGVQGLSLNWGYLILAPVISGNVFNLFYGHVYDYHSTMPDGAQGECREGLLCYRDAYFLTLASSVVGVAMALWCIRYEARQRTSRARLSRGS